LLQFLFSIFLTSLVAVGFSLFANWINPYEEDLFGVLVNNVLIFAVVNILMVLLLEAWIFYKEGKKAGIIAENLERELLQIKFQMLKDQINPHFLFNSLNVLSGLISKDVAKAQLFIDEFSHMYRYVLERLESSEATLEEELDFMRSYLYLQEIRYGKHLNYSIDIPSAFLACLMPPLSLQTVLENAIKHNVINERNPLHIEVFVEDDFLVVRNNLQPKSSSVGSTGLGIKNLSRRYSMICDHSPTFTVKTNCYIAKLPLISLNDFESSYNRR
jgi:two-component system, LytTR family, sensor kinase